MQAIAELEADGETTEEEKNRINQASSIEEVEEEKDSILYNRKIFLKNFLVILLDLPIMF